MGKWAVVPSEAILVLRLQKGPRRSDFSGSPFATNAVPQKGRARNLFERRRKKCCLNFFDFLENDYNSAEYIKFLERSIFNNSASFGP